VKSGSWRGSLVGEDGLVFVGLAGGHLDASTLLRRYRAALRTARLRPIDQEESTGAR
jgi:hypothetical protein